MIDDYFLQNLYKFLGNKINEEVATQMLLSTNGDLRKVEENLRQFREVARNPLPEENAAQNGKPQNVIDEDFDLYRDADDDRDRMNYDVYEFLEEIKFKNKKEGKEEV